MRLASGCDAPIPAIYSALSPAAATGPDARYQSRAHQAPVAANSAPARSRRPVRRPARNPPMRPKAAIAVVGARGLLLIIRTLSADPSQLAPVWTLSRTRKYLSGTRTCRPPRGHRPGHIRAAQPVARSQRDG